MSTPAITRKGLARSAAVRQQTPPGLNADTLVGQLGLSADARGRIAPHIAELNSLLERQADLSRQNAELWTVVPGTSGVDR